MATVDGGGTGNEPTGASAHMTTFTLRCKIDDNICVKQYRYYCSFMNRLSSECSDSAKREIDRQLDELKKHSGKDSSDILPKPEKIVQRCKRKKDNDIVKNESTLRERLYATVINSSN